MSRPVFGHFDRLIGLTRLKFARQSTQRPILRRLVGPPAQTAQWLARTKSHKVGPTHYFALSPEPEVLEPKSLQIRLIQPKIGKSSFSKIFRFSKGGPLEIDFSEISILLRKWRFSGHFSLDPL